jgi:hypothetical protein
MHHDHQLWTNILDGSVKVVSRIKKHRYPSSMFDAEGNSDPSIDNFVRFLHAVNEVRERRLLMRQMKMLMNSFNKTKHDCGPRPCDN